MGSFIRIYVFDAKLKNIYIVRKYLFSRSQTTGEVT